MYALRAPQVFDGTDFVAGGATVLVERLTPLVGEAYEQLADRPTEIGLRYEPAWRVSGLAAALAADSPASLGSAQTTNRRA